MGIKTADGPAGASAAIARALSNLSSGGPATFDMERAAPQHLTKPIQVFTVPVDLITSLDFLDMATPIGWRYLVVDSIQEPGSLAAVDVKEDEAGSATFQALSHGRMPERLAEASQLAANLLGDTPQDFEVRILELPALYLAALWLIGTDRSNLFIPFLDATASAPVRVDPEFPARVLARATAKRQKRTAEPGRSN
jgi:hypothetical protein